jgi:hypothetical protein
MIRNPRENGKGEWKFGSAPSYHLRVLQMRDRIPLLSVDEVGKEKRVANEEYLCVLKLIDEKSKE